MEKPSKHSFIPIMSIQKFRKEQLVGREEILFNELIGEREIRSPHKHDFFMIALFEQASGTHNIDSIDYPIGNREVHVLFPNQVHKWSINTETIGYQLMIEKIFFEQFAPFFRFSFTNYQKHPVIKLSLKTFTTLMYEFTAIKEELKSSNSLIQLISARAAVIAATISKEAELTFSEFKIYQSNPRLAEFNILIDKHYKDQKYPSFYAEKLNISTNYLNILCNRHLGVSSTKLIHQRIIVEAKRLLQISPLTIKEMAFELGFVDHSYFSNFFKSQTGISPTVFRAQQQQVQ